MRYKTAVDLLPIASFGIATLILIIAVRTNTVLSLSVGAFAVMVGYAFTIITAPIESKRINGIDDLAEAISASGKSIVFSLLVTVAIITAWFISTGAIPMQAIIIAATAFTILHMMLTRVFVARALKRQCKDMPKDNGKEIS